MQVPLSWLKEYVDVNIAIEELAERLTLAGLEVSALERIGDWWDRERILVGEVIEVRPHPNADRLTLPVVKYGAPEPIQVVTGAPNLRIGDKGQKVALALAGSRLIDGHSADRRYITLRPSNIRGVRSEGMVCSEKELGISEEHEGILILSEDAPVGMPLVDYLGDVILTIDITPNLARCLSIIGVAQEVAALTGQDLHVAEPFVLEMGAPAAKQVEVEIADPDLCSRYCATVIRNVTVVPSPFWLQRRLTLAGVRPINNIVDITNYVMMEWGQPLHAFDYDLLHGRNGGRPPSEPPLIRVRRARVGERMTTLDGQERQLDPEILLITDGAGPVAVAGIMGGLESEIGPGTGNVLLEAASFDMIGNRVAAQKLRLSSEASSRFGRGVPASLADRASRRAAELMRLLAGGEVQKGIVQAYPVPQPKVVVTLRPERARSVLGLNVSDKEIERILVSLGFTINKDGWQWLVEAPQQRLDIAVEEDLYEEIARVYGYDRLPGTLLRDELPPQRHDKSNDGEEFLRNVLVTCGLQEVITYSLTDWRSEVPLLEQELGENDYVRVLNPLSADRQWLRRSLLPGLLAVARDNFRQVQLVRLFEIGNVYIPQPGQDLPEERLQLGFLLGGLRHEPSWSAPDPDTLDFFDGKGVLDELAQRLGLALRLEARQHRGLHPGRCAAVILEGIGPIGYFGELHPQLRPQLDLPDYRICIGELDLKAVFEAWIENPHLEAVSRYPAVIQDMALLLPQEVPAATVEDRIRRVGRELLVSVTLFDVYQGEGIPEGQRSLAFRLVYQAADRTLTDQEVQRLHSRIAQRLQAELGAKLRE
ncbi:MAG: phenylalanine--tRNA ligase subunit beta [Anaerolineae bacterium]